MCYIVIVLRDMVKQRWWSATDIKHRKHVKTCVTCMQQFKYMYCVLMLYISAYISYSEGNTLELEQPQYFVDGRGTLQAKKGR